MKKSEITLIVLVSIVIFLLVYSPHFDYQFPLHVDEWHHITEAEKIGNGEYSGGAIGFRVGFHFLLYLSSFFLNLVEVYQFFPAIWAVVTALVLFFVVYKKTEKSYWIALLTMVFFASLKSNVNLGGLWFFTSLTFSLPFIFLYLFFFSEGIEKKNKKYIMISLIIMLFLIPIHSISVLFALPFLFVYCLFHIKYLIKEWKLFSLFLAIPIIGVIFYSILKHLSFLDSIARLFNELQFERGWGVLELNNSFFELYSPIGYVLALLGIYYLIDKYGLKRNKYLVYLIWPILTFISILIFKIFGVSLFAPYQRTMYYFAISLPILSAFGVYYLFKIRDNYISRNPRIKDKENRKKFSDVIIVILILLMTFCSYASLPPVVKVYHLIGDNDYDSLLFLKNYSVGRVMAPLGTSMASYAIAGKPPVGALYFYGNKSKTKEFFSFNSSNNCTQQNKLLRQQNVSYVLAEKPIDCNWTLIYNETNVIYNVKNISNLVKKFAQ